VFYVYLLRNYETGRTYIGYTNDLQRRVRQHGPDKWELIFYEAYKSEQDARDRERRLKQYGKSLAMLKKRIARSLV
jgi:predicted GIY-YIG superfamily endonuclease